VLDVFYVTDTQGREIADDGQLAVIREGLTRALTPEAPEEPVAEARAAGS
jgi:hypothetical protein